MTASETSPQLERIEGLSRVHLLLKGRRMTRARVAGEALLLTGTLLMGSPCSAWSRPIESAQTLAPATVAYDHAFGLSAQPEPRTTVSVSAPRVRLPNPRMTDTARPQRPGRSLSEPTVLVVLGVGLLAAAGGARRLQGRGLLIRLEIAVRGAERVAARQAQDTLFARGAHAHRQHRNSQSSTPPPRS